MAQRSRARSSALGFVLLSHLCTALQVNVQQPANHLGRALKICSVQEVGFIQSSNATKLKDWPEMSGTTPTVFSKGLGNMESINGFDVDFVNQVRVSVRVSRIK